mmetsp:Transcript_4670/g.11596  ORF Transcript_4670/g.11596 Transcript_4670/m.11596 type:complete len:286 (+) Transcript_4670:108-965(+)
MAPCDRTKAGRPVQAPGYGDQLGGYALRVLRGERREDRLRALKVPGYAAGEAECDHADALDRPATAGQGAPHHPYQRGQGCGRVPSAGQWGLGAAGGDAQDRGAAGVLAHGRVRGGHLLHHVQPQAAGQVPHPAVRHDAVHGLRCLRHPGHHRVSPGHQGGRRHEQRRPLHAHRGGVLGRVRQCAHGADQRLVLRGPHARHHGQAARRPQGGAACQDRPAERAHPQRGADGPHLAPRRGEWPAVPRPLGGRSRGGGQVAPARYCRDDARHGICTSVRARLLPRGQ